MIELKRALLDEDKMQDSNNISNSDKQILNAIYTGFIKQDATEFLASSSNLGLWYRNKANAEDTDTVKPTKFLYLLKTRIESGDVPVISIGVYDNNCPGEKRYVDMICNKKNCVTKANSYYSKSNAPIRISLSLQSDIEYFKES